MMIILIDDDDDGLKDDEVGMKKRINYTFAGKNMYISPKTSRNTSRLLR